jgi:hypothetical protein
MIDAQDRPGVRADDPGSYLTLSAPPEPALVPDDYPSVTELRAERDPAIVTEAELRLMWGDR